MLKVWNMESTSGRKVANQFVITTGGTYTLQSYDSTIVSIDFSNKLVIFYEDWDYSRTTGKYRNMFLRDYFEGLDNKHKVLAAMEAGEIDGFRVVKAW